MLQNKEDLKNKIIYRASYRGTKEMDILMIAFVKSLINTLDIDNLIALDKLVNMNDESLISIKKKETIINNNDKSISYIIKRFQDF
tara:strand:- start:382 stop:639 length:258 start_codon:yes stop_codon:yes gene_type:complete